MAAMSSDQVGEMTATIMAAVMQKMQEHIGTQQEKPKDSGDKRVRKLEQKGFARLEKSTEGEVF